MKKICFLFFALFLTTGAAFSQSFWDDMASGSWKGSGTLMGSEADFYMKWTWELNDKFLKLEFQNKRTSSSGQELVLKAHAYYQLKNDTLLEGTWFDNRGITFPVRGVLQDSTFTVNWGSPETEQGRTIYTIISDVEAKVTDFVLREGQYARFGEAIYHKKTNPKTEPMKRVTGIGGIFFKSKDPQKLKEWYNTHLGLKTDQYGTSFEWRQGADPAQYGFTQWSPFKESTTYFKPSEKDFMINYRVENLEALVEELKKEGVTVLDEIETYDYGKFVHILDIEGNKIELWEPNDVEYDKIVDGRTK